MAKLRLSKVETIVRPVTVRLPTKNPNTFNEGTISYEAKVKTKEELAALSEKGLSDVEYIDELVVSVDGLGDDQDAAINGDAALNEVKHGRWSTYLTTAIIQDYFERFGEARGKNPKTSRGR